MTVTSQLQIEQNIFGIIPIIKAHSTPQSTKLPYLQMLFRSGVGFTNDYIYRVMPKSIKEVEEIAELTNRIGSFFKNGKVVKITTKKEQT